MLEDICIVVGVARYWALLPRDYSNLQLQEATVTTVQRGSGAWGHRGVIVVDYL